MLAFTFPGQGSQRPAMGAAWRGHPSFELVDQASEATERDVAHLLLDAGLEELTRTDNAQLATFVASLVVLDATERLGIEPAALAGHSLGEYSALVASGALSYEDGLRLVAERGAAMQDAAEQSPGTMAAVLGLDDDAVEAACQRAEGDVWVANFNAPGQVVIAGRTDAVEAASRIARSLGARKVLPIPVGGAFHTPLMAPARERLRKALAEVGFRPAEPAVVANVDAREHADPAEWPSLLSAQLCSPVRWRQSLDTLYAAGVRTVVELGPGGVLTGLARRVLPAEGTLFASVSTPEDLERLVEALAGGTGGGLGAGIAPERQGERLHIAERLVVAPATGVFEPAPALAAMAPGAGVRALAGAAPVPPPRLEVGELIGQVGDREVRSPFAGVLQGLLVLPGERVLQSQPVAWLRAEGDEHGRDGDPARAGAR